MKCDFLYAMIRATHPLGRGIGVFKVRSTEKKLTGGTDTNLFSDKQKIEQKIFDHCYKKYYSRIQSYFHARYGSQFNADDVIQDAFLFFWARGVAQVNLNQNPFFYLKAIVRNTLYHSWIKKENTCVRFDEAVHDHGRQDPCTTLRNFYELIAPLNSEERRVVELCYLYGYNRLEAARLTHVSRRTCFRQLTHAKEKLSHLYASELQKAG